MATEVSMLLGMALDANGVSHDPTGGMQGPERWCHSPVTRFSGISR